MSRHQPTITPDVLGLMALLAFIAAVAAISGAIHADKIDFVCEEGEVK